MRVFFAAWIALLLSGAAMLHVLHFQGAANAHPAWTQRNEPGPWTVALYHFDETDLEAGDWLYSADGDSQLNLQIVAAEKEALESTHQVARPFLERAIVAYSPLTAIAPGTVEHPTRALSLEIWLRFLERGADIEFGLEGGVTLRIRIGGEGDRFQLMGANVTGADDVRYAAPGFRNFPPAGDWHHYGVVINAPQVHPVEGGLYEYGAGAVARFYYDSHIVGFVGEQSISLEGLRFSAEGAPALKIHSGVLAFDEMMISNVDWSDPVGHGGIGHGGTRIDHAFENGRQPVSVSDWNVY